MSAINLKQLAAQLNLSIATVSKALKDSYEVNEATKKRVKEMADLLNYQPNPYASSLRKQKSNTIAVIIPKIDNNFFSLVIDGIETIAQEKGYHVLIYLSNEDYKKEVAFTRHLNNGRVDGVLISLSATTTDTKHLAALQKEGIPVVFFDRVASDIKTARVTTNDYESAYDATQHLIDAGCKKIAYLSISKNISINNKRMEGYKEALKNNNQPVNDNLVIYCDKGEDDSRIQIENLLMEDKPDGIFASVEQLAISSYMVCNQLKIKIPEEVKVVSFSNLPTASLLYPSLTTITQPAFEIGRQAASILFKSLGKKKVPIADEDIVVKSELIKRRSTAC